MTNTITVKELAREARNLAMAHPDRVAVCSYTIYDDGELVPNCIVGTAAHNLGVSLEELYSVNTCGIRHLVFNETPEWLDASDNGAAPVITWLGWLQGSQDGGATWGEALNTADRFLVMNEFGI